MKSYTRFRLVPKSSTLDDAERPWTAKTHSGAEKIRLLEPTAQIWMKIDPYMQRQKCRPMTLVSGNIRCRSLCGYSQRVPLGGGTSNDSGVVDDGNFWRFQWLSLETSEIRPGTSNIWRIIWRYVPRLWSMRYTLCTTTWGGGVCSAGGGSSPKQRERHVAMSRASLKQQFLLTCPTHAIYVYVQIQQPSN